MPKITTGGASNVWETPEPADVVEIVGDTGPEIAADELPAPKPVRKPRKSAQPAPEEA